MGVKFLCCLPVRLGVLVISIIQFFSCSICAGLLWFALYHYRHDDDKISIRLRISAIIYATIYTVAAVLSIVGFIGALTKKLNYIKSFSGILNYILGLQIGFGILYLILFFVEPKSRLIDRCIDGSRDQTVIENCNRLFNNRSKPWVIVVTIIIVLIPILIQLYQCYIVAAYAKKLRNKDRSFILESQDGYKYRPAKSADDSQPLTAPYSTYPYSDAPNSFGNTGPYHSGGAHA